MTARIGASVRRARADRRLNGDDLTEALNRLGIELTRNALANLETGRRDTISIGEWFGLACVLDVAPAALLLPDPVADVTVLPNRPPVPGHWALEWITGAGERLPDDLLSEPTDDAEQRYRGSCAALRACREHDDLVLDVMLARVDWHDDSDDARYRRTVTRLADHRAYMREHGWSLPELPGDSEVERALDAIESRPTRVAVPATKSGT